MKVLLELVFSFSQIAAGAFGGGLSTLPLIEYQLVRATGWLTPLILCGALCLLKKLEAEKSRKFKDMLRPIVGGLLTLSLISPLTVTAKNGVTAMAMLILGILLLRTCKFFKNYPPVLLVIYGIIGAVIFS